MSWIFWATFGAVGLVALTAFVSCCLIEYQLNRLRLYVRDALRDDVRRWIRDECETLYGPLGALEPPDLIAQVRAFARNTAALRGVSVNA